VQTPPVTPAPRLGYVRIVSLWARDLDVIAGWRWAWFVHGCFALGRHAGS